MYSFYTKTPSAGLDTKGVVFLPIAEAAKFKFDTPVVSNVVYVSHPARAGRLVVFAKYDDIVNNEYVNEALRIFQQLGASSVTAYAHKAEATKGKAEIGVSVVDFEANFSKSSDWKVEFRSRGNGSLPIDPRPLLFPSAPGFDAACDAVIKNGAKQIALMIRSESTFSMNGELAGILKGVPFRLGAAAEGAKYSLFVVQAEFNYVKTSEMDQGTQIRR
jgi:hypothetical protein